MFFSKLFKDNKRVVANEIKATSKDLVESLVESYKENAELE